MSNDFLVYLVLISIIIELLAVKLATTLWLRLSLITICLAIILGSVLGILINLPNLFSWLLLLVTFYRVFNLARAFRVHLNQQALLSRVYQSSLSLTVMSLLLLMCSLQWQSYIQPHRRAIFAVLIGSQLVAALLLVISTIRSLIKTTPPSSFTQLTDISKLPTVSVCIPARNETWDLEACLQTVVANTYPKLEVIVLDDCSQNKRTPEIIRSFAQDGVRFIAGTAPKDSWLAKNWAYEQLRLAATGDILIFCGVDIRFDTDSINKLVELIDLKSASMISLVPQRTDSARLPLIQPMRYFWELALPRRQLRRPPALSSCWVVTSKALKQAGGFSGVARSISPEAVLARGLIQHDAYKFIRSQREIGVSSAKVFSEQRSTAIRTRYPQLHRKPEMVALLSLAELVLLLLPFGLLIMALYLFIPTLIVVTFLTCLMLLVSLALVIHKTMHTSRLWEIIALPLVVIVDLALVHYSMFKYEFSVVEWKGRNVCLPVLKY